MILGESFTRVAKMGWVTALSVTVLVGCSGADSDFSSRLRLTPVARFGSVDSSLALQRVLRLLVSPGRTRLYVTQWPVPSLLVLSREGDSLGVVGRGGSGPGEFGGPPMPAWKGDTLWVPDSDHTLVLYDSLGTFIRQASARVPPLGPFQSTPWPIAPLDNDAILFRGSAATGRIIQGTVTDLPLVRVDPGGSVSNTVVQVSVTGSAMSVTWQDGSMVVGESLWGLAPKWTVLPDAQGLLVVDPRDFSASNPRFRLSRIDMTGDTVLSGLVRSEPIPLSPEHIDALVGERFSYRLEDGRRSLAAMVRSVREQVEIPAYHPPVISLLGSLDGSIWITGPHASADSISVSVLDGDDLTLIGSTSLANGVELLWVSMTEVWGTVLGSWGESYIVRFEPSWD